MSIKRTLLALGLLAAIMLVGCKQPVGLPNNDVHVATTHTVYATTNALINPTGHIDLYQYGELSSQVYLDWDTLMITRAFYRYSQQHPDWPYPRQIGVCQFKIPPFDCPSGIPACTLYYYQESHSGDADLLFNAWYANVQWPPQPAGYYTIYMTIWNSTDTLATDSTRANDDCWHKVPLRLSACAAIADSGATGDTTVLLTGWVYSGTENGYYTDVSGTYASNPPYIKIVYDD